MGSMNALFFGGVESSDSCFVALFHPPCLFLLLLGIAVG